MGDDEAGRRQATHEEVEAWLDRAVQVVATGLDLGVRRRVGILRDLPTGAREVTGWDGGVTRFPSRNAGHASRLSEEDRASLRRSIHRREGLSPEPGEGPAAPSFG